MRESCRRFGSRILCNTRNQYNFLMDDDDDDDEKATLVSEIIVSFLYSCVS